MSNRFKIKKPQVSSMTPEVFSPVFPYSPTGTVKKKQFTEDQKIALQMGQCPYCDTDDTDVEGFIFGGSDDREGGFLDCGHCKVRIAWIDNPYEAEEQNYSQEEKNPCGP